MTTPDERTRAVVWARDFLEELTKPAKTPGVPDIVRRRALMLLRHYPDAKDMKLARFAFEEWFAPTEESDIG